MNKLVKTLTIKEAVDLAKNSEWISEFLSTFPNNFGINLCAVESITFKCEDDEFGQLTDLYVKFIPSHNKEDYESMKYNNCKPWLLRNEDRSGIDLIRK